MYINTCMYICILYTYICICIYRYINIYIYICKYIETAIFPKKQGRKREISNESARGSSLREANV